ncbi:MAG: alpha/beta fold hydrolase [Silvibacterium sp.]
MQEAIDGRELIVLDDLEVTVRGTYHKPVWDNLAEQLQPDTQDRVGVLFLNGLYATRASNGDSAVYWADSFAECGYPCFRIDLPGYGDSDGDPPADWLGFINTGGYASIAAAAMKKLVARFHLSGMVIVGHCAGAVSAIYAAAASEECKGLVLMDPYFHLPQPSSPSIRQQLRMWALQNRIGGSLSKVFDFLKHIRLLFHRNSLPANANSALLRCWKGVASTGLPILFLKAPARRASGVKARVGEFDYLEHILKLAGRKSRIAVKVMEGANHSFSNNAGLVAVRQNTELWLKTCFPIVQPDKEPLTVSHCEPGDGDRRSYRMHVQPLSQKVEN